MVFVTFVASIDTGNGVVTKHGNIEMCIDVFSGIDDIREAEYHIKCEYKDLKMTDVIITGWKRFNI